MNQKLMRFKRYIDRWLGNRQSFSLTELMEEFRGTLNFWGTCPGPRVFTVVKPYYRQLEHILGRYRIDKKATKNPIRRKKLRIQTAKNFFEVVSQIHGIIPKMLSEIPKDLPEDKFEDWKTATGKKADLKVIAEIVRKHDQLEILRGELEEIYSSTEPFINNGKLKKLVFGKIKQESVSDKDYNDIHISSPTIKHGPEIR